MAADLELAWACVLHKTEAGDHVDYYATRRGQRLSEIEIKVKACPSTRYPGIYVDAAKVAALLTRARQYGTTPLYVVEYTDGVLWIDVRAIVEKCAAAEVTGRTDRGDRHDRRATYRVPRAMFRRLR